MSQDVVFGRYRFTAATGQLWSGQSEVRLTPKAAALLATLVTHPGQLVAKEELFAAVWPDTVVSDDALTSCVRELRKALSDDVKHPRFIETRHRRGYRFIAPLARLEPDESTAASPALAQTAARITDREGKPTVAVLPFNNVSGDPQQEYFADGITGDIITALSRHRSLLVIARGSSFAFKGRPPGRRSPSCCSGNLSSRAPLPGGGCSS